MMAMFGFSRNPPAPQVLDLQKAHKKSSATRNRAVRQASFAVLIVLILAGVVSVAWFSWPKNSAVPSKYRHAFSFPVYYPAARKIPSGYFLNTDSFTSPTNNVLLYSVRHGRDKIVFSLQQKPSANELSDFNTQRIPLHTDIHTALGTAVVGAIGNQSITSLPTQDNTWIIITAPYNQNQGQLNQLMNSLKKT
jgi:hypothetical protein